MQRQQVFGFAIAMVVCARGTPYATKIRPKRDAILLAKRACQRCHYLVFGSTAEQRMRMGDQRYALRIVMILDENLDLAIGPVDQDAFVL